MIEKQFQSNALRKTFEIIRNLALMRFNWWRKLILALKFSGYCLSSSTQQKQYYKGDIRYSVNGMANEIVNLELASLWIRATWLWCQRIHTVSLLYEKAVDIEVPNWIENAKPDIAFEKKNPKSLQFSRIQKLISDLLDWSNALTEM